MCYRLIVGAYTFALVKDTLRKHGILIEDEYELAGEPNRFGLFVRLGPNSSKDLNRVSYLLRNQGVINITPEQETY